jgi:hypothetical protein
MPQTATQTYNLAISPSALALGPPTLPPATVGVAYSAQLSASGGVPPYTYAVTSGSLPAGLTLDPNSGILSGTPTTFGTSTFVVTATDSGA